MKNTSILVLTVVLLVVGLAGCVNKQLSNCKPVSLNFLSKQIYGKDLAAVRSVLRVNPTFKVENKNGGIVHQVGATYDFQGYGEYSRLPTVFLTYRELERALQRIKHEGDQKFWCDYS